MGQFFWGPNKGGSKTSGSKKWWSKNVCVPNNLWVEIILGKKNLGKMFFGSITFGLKKNWINKFFCSKQFFGPTNMEVKKNWVQEKIWV